MLHVKDSLFQNFKFGAFTFLVFYSVILSCRGESQVIGSSNPIVAQVGEGIILPCRLDPALNALDMTLEWVRPDLDPRFVFVWRDGVELKNKKHPSYQGRTSMFPDELENGNISLKLSKVKISDEGKYRCFIPGLKKESYVQLVVDDFFPIPPGSSSSAPIVIGVVVGLMVILIAAAVVVVWKCRKNKIRENKNHKDEKSQNVTENKKMNSEQEILMQREKESIKLNNMQTESEESPTNGKTEDPSSKEKEKLTRMLKIKEREEGKWEKKVSRREGQVKVEEKTIHDLKLQLEEMETERKLQKDKMVPETQIVEAEQLLVIQKKLERREPDLERIKNHLANERREKKKASNEKEETIKKLNEMGGKRKVLDPESRQSRKPK